MPSSFYFFRTNTYYLYERLLRGIYGELEIIEEDDGKGNNDKIAIVTGANSGLGN